jgi:hypothetical protein
MKAWLVAILLAGCANDGVEDGIVVMNPPDGGKSDESCEWTREVVDEQLGRSRGEHSTVRIDADGFAHIVYEDRLADDPYHQGEVAIRYATNRSGEWVTSVVSTTCRFMAGELEYLPLGTQANSNLDLDEDGHAFIACSEGSSVLMLDNASGAWRETQVRTPAGAFAECRAKEGPVAEGYSMCRYNSYGRHSAIRLDSHGTPHLVYSVYRDVQYSSPVEWLEYATRDGNSWRVETVGGRSYYFDVAIDSSDHVHITAQQSGDITTGNYFGYMTNATGAWQGTTLHSVYRGSLGNFASAAVSSSGRLHALQFDNTYYDDLGYTAALTYVKKGNGQPLIGELKRDHATRAYAPDIALDADENLHVAYHDEGSLAYQVVNGDEAAAPVIVDHGGVGSHASLALGGGTIHVSYFDEGEARLKYARWTCTQ